MTAGLTASEIHLRPARTSGMISCCSFFEPKFMTGGSCTDGRPYGQQPDRGESSKSRRPTYADDHATLEPVHVA